MIKEVLLVGAGHNVKLKKGVTVIGKKEDACDYVIEGNPAISRTHCSIEVTDNGITLIDLGSANGTFIDGERVTPSVKYDLTIGSLIRVANVEFRLEGEVEESETKVEETKPELQENAPVEEKKLEETNQAPQVSSTPTNDLSMSSAKVKVEFINLMKKEAHDLEVPVDITAKDLILALNYTYNVGINTANEEDCYMVMERPIGLVKGRVVLEDLGIRNGSVIIYTR